MVHSTIMTDSIKLLLLMVVTCGHLIEHVTCVLPLSLGCSMDTQELTIRCRSNNLDYIVKSMYILVPEKGRAPETTTVTTVTTTNVTVASINDLNNSSETIVVVKQAEHVEEGAHELDIFYCDVPELPNIFARLNGSLERVRVARSNVQSVTVNAFEGLETKLRFLDLSGNKLLTVPMAIANLTRLEVLNLRDNKIQVIADGPTFYRTVRLRELHLGFNNLGYIDNSKLQLYTASGSGLISGSGSGSGSASGQKSVLSGGGRRPPQHSPIGLAVFSLGNTTQSLEVLSLRGNAFSNYPEQLMADFPRLKSLDLSFNSLVEVPEDAFRAMPELQFVNLDANFIRTLKFTNLPETLKLFTLKNNPMRCDCDVKWILDWIYTNTSLTVLLPKCNAPFNLREISFLRLTSDKLCNQSYVDRQNVYVTDRDLGYFPLGVFQSIKIRHVHGEFRSIFVSWKVDPQFYLSQREWLIIYRSLEDEDGANMYTFNRTLFTSKSYVENETDWTTVERVFNDNIRNLTADQFYQVCIALVENNINYIHLNHCRVAQTEPEMTAQHFATNHNSNPTSGAALIATSTGRPPTPDYRIDSRLVKIKADTSRSITVLWKVVVQSAAAAAAAAVNANANANDTLNFDEESPLVLNTLTAIYNELRWKITYRKFSMETTTAITIMKNNYVVTGPNTHQYTIANLLPGTGYNICFETINDLSMKGNRLMASGSGGSTYVSFDERSGSSICKEIKTNEEKHFPGTEVTIAAIISCVITSIILIALFFYARKRLLIITSSKLSNTDKDDDTEIASQRTSNTDCATTGGVHDDHVTSHVDSDESDHDDVGQKSNGHINRWPSYAHPPKVTSIFPPPEVPSYRNGVYHSSFRHFENGIPTYGSTQRNGTYPKSILKKSPSAPSLTETERPSTRMAFINGHVGRPTSINYDRSLSVDDYDDPVAKFEASARNGEVELRKIFMVGLQPEAARPKSS